MRSTEPINLVPRILVYESDKYEINQDTLNTQLITTDSGYILSGNKKYVMFGDVSDYIAVLAKHEDGYKFVLVSFASFTSNI